MSRKKEMNAGGLLLLTDVEMRVYAFWVGLLPHDCGQKEDFVEDKENDVFDATLKELLDSYQRGSSDSDLKFRILRMLHWPDIDVDHRNRNAIVRLTLAVDAITLLIREALSGSRDASRKRSLAEGMIVRVQDDLVGFLPMGHRMVSAYEFDVFVAESMNATADLEAVNVIVRDIIGLFLAGGLPLDGLAVREEGAFSIVSLASSPAGV